MIWAKISCARLSFSTRNFTRISRLINYKTCEKLVFLWYKIDFFVILKVLRAVKNTSIYLYFRVSSRIHKST